MKMSNLHLYNSSQSPTAEMTESDDLLGFWGRCVVITIGTVIVLLTIAIVICLVGQRCWLHLLIFGGNRKKKKLDNYEKEKLFTAEPPLISYKTSDTLVQNSTPFTKENHQQKSNFFQTSMRRLTPPFMGNQTVGENNSLLGSLSTKRDSTYSSMSENSGRTSPTNSCRSSVEGSMCSAGGSNVGSPTTVGDAQGQISFGLQFIQTNEERGTGRLMITIGEAKGLQGRQYMGGACDPYVKVILWKERRTLRKQKGSPLHVYRTRTVRHTTEPSFDETFVTEVNKSDLRDLMVKIVAMDSDKWVSPTTLGEVVQPLRDIKTLPTNPEKTILNYFLAPAKLELGEILFGLSYLPTAQRLSVSVIKAAHLKYSNVVDDITNFCPYVRALLISPSGRVLRKKKTTFRNNTEKPVWNETLIFDMPQNYVDNVTFILAVCSRPPPPPDITSNEAIINAEIEENLSLSSPPSESRSETRSSPALESYRKHDKNIGKVVLGCNVAGEEERKHWITVLSAPRKVASQWHSLK